MNAIVTTTNNHLLVGTEVYGIYRSTDNARHWRETNTGLTNPYVIMACRLDRRTLIAGLRMGGTFLSTDDGESWFHRSFSWQNITAVSSGPSGYTYAIVDQPHVRFQRSDDNGETWSFFVEGLPECQISSLLVDRKGDIFLSTNGFGIFFSEDNAEHWTDRNRGLTEMDVQRIIFTKKNSVIAITSGRYFSLNRCRKTVASFVSSRDTGAFRERKRTRSSFCGHKWGWNLSSQTDDGKSVDKNQFSIGDRDKIRGIGRSPVRNDFQRRPVQKQRRGNYVEGNW